VVEAARAVHSQGVWSSCRKSREPSSLLTTPKMKRVMSSVLRESEIDRSEWLPYVLAQIESPNPEFALACLTPWLSRILHESLLEGE
jgi:hypothetical protein